MTLGVIASATAGAARQECLVDQETQILHLWSIPQFRQRIPGDIAGPELQTRGMRTVGKNPQGLPEEIAALVKRVIKVQIIS